MSGVTTPDFERMEQWLIAQQNSRADDDTVIDDADDDGGQRM